MTYIIAVHTEQELVMFILFYITYILYMLSFAILQVIIVLFKNL